jgi:hypothetical protein
MENRTLLELRKNKAADLLTPFGAAGQPTADLPLSDGITVTPGCCQFGPSADWQTPGVAAALFQFECVPLIVWAATHKAKHRGLSFVEPTLSVSST